MKLRSDTIGHSDDPTEKTIRDAVCYSDEGGREGDLVKLMIDDNNFISIWIGSRSIGHRMTLKSEGWKLDSSHKVSSEIAIDTMTGYLRGNLSKLQEFQWERPIDKVFLDNIKKFREIRNIK